MKRRQHAPLKRRPLFRAHSRVDEHGRHLTVLHHSNGLVLGPRLLHDDELPANSYASSFVRLRFRRVWFERLNITPSGPYRATSRDSAGRSTFIMSPTHVEFHRSSAETRRPNLMADWRLDGTFPDGFDVLPFWGSPIYVAARLITHRAGVIPSGCMSGRGRVDGRGASSDKTSNEQL